MTCSLNNSFARAVATRFVNRISPAFALAHGYDSVNDDSNVFLPVLPFVLLLLFRGSDDTFRPFGDYGPKPLPLPGSAHGLLVGSLTVR